MANAKKALEYRPGDYVVATDESYGWGNVQRGDVGIVTGIVPLPGAPRGYQVKFHVQDEWNCRAQDLRPATVSQRRSAFGSLQGPSQYVTSINPTMPIDFDDLQKLMRGMKMGVPTTMAIHTDTPAKPRAPRMPKHLKGLKNGVSVRVTSTDCGYFDMGDVFKVTAIDTGDKTVRGHSTQYDGQYWIPFDCVTTELEGSESKVHFDSVILEDHKKQKILATIKQVDNYDLIFEKWGFGSVLEKGKAISMLFFGPPGTGKTLCAQAIADHLQKKLKVIGSAEIESSEPGQAERNIKAFFEGTKDDTVLLFDECDSLVYSREQVGSILAAQVNQLLSSLEAFEGIVIFTTNRLGVLDEAFNRRLSLKLEFAMPTAEQRIAIWQRMFPKKAPVADDIDWQQLAEVELSGGYIKNVVLRAARMAAAEDIKDKDKKITMRHLVEALTDEATSVIEFEDARRHNHTPRMMGGGVSRGIQRGVSK